MANMIRAGQAKARGYFLALSLSSADVVYT
jgi:hypothetical protein